MDRYARLSISQKLATLVMVFVVGFAAIGRLAYRELEHVKVNGPLYTDIVRHKDLIADVLPPPEYIIETYLVTLRLSLERDKSVIAELIARGRDLRAEYDRRHQFWRTQPISAELKQSMLVRSYQPAVQFYDVWEREFVPAVQSGDDAKVAELIEGKLERLYDEHRRAIDEVVTQSTKSASDGESAAATVVANGSTQLFALASLIALASVIIAFLIARSLMSRLRSSSISLMSTATEIAATSKQQQSTITNYSASTAEIAAAVKEISATSQELRSTLDQLVVTASKSSELAEAGRTGLDDMDTTMRTLSESTVSISSKLEAIREKASDITKVVTSITKVADQTNLLSVNAAIEAEKAGEYGLGFLVVAREIRRLADQSAVATLDIEQMVAQMQSAVSAGVMEMDKFGEQVRRGVRNVGQINAQLGEVIEQVQGQTERIESVKQGMHSQAAGASQINDAMSHLSDGVRQTAASLQEFNTATDSLRDVVAGLRREVSSSAA